jgi:hypothetical protein
MRLLKYFIAAMLIAALWSGAASAGTYTNAEYGFSFEYPEGHTLKSSSELNFTLKDKEGETVLTGEVEDIKLYPRELYEGYSDPFQKFGTWRATLRCDADGPDGSAYCPSMKSTKEFTTRNGFRALELMLMHVQLTFGKHAKREESVTGPLYLVDLSREDHTVVLMLGVPPHERMTEKQKKLAKSILGTIKFAK